MESISALLCHQIAGNGKKDLSSDSRVSSYWRPVLIDIDDLHKFHTRTLARIVQIR